MPMNVNLNVGNLMHSGTNNTINKLSADQNAVPAQLRGSSGVSARQIPESGLGKLVNGNADAGNLLQGLQQAPHQSIGSQSGESQMPSYTEPKSIMTNDNAAMPNRADVLSQAGARANALATSAPQSALNLLKQSG